MDRSTSGQRCVQLAKNRRLWLCLSVGCKLRLWVTNQSRDLLCGVRGLQKITGEWLHWQESNGTFVLSTEKRSFCKLCRSMTDVRRRCTPLIKISWLSNLLVWITNICIQQDLPRMWNKGSDVSPKTLAVLTAYGIIRQIQSYKITHCKLLCNDLVSINQNRIITTSSKSNKHAHQ